MIYLTNPRTEPCYNYLKMTDVKGERSEAALLAAESVEKFRAAAERERESRGAPRDERLRVLSETIEAEGQAIEEFGEAVGLQTQAIEGHAAEPDTEE